MLPSTEMFGMKYFFIILLVIGIASLVSAQYYGGSFSTTQQVIDSIVTNLEPFLRVLLGGNDWTGYLLFEKVLLFLLVTIMVALILGNLPMFQGKKKGIIRLVAVIIGVLGVRNLNYVWVNTILVQYQVLFIAVAGILPFMIYWYFVKDLAPAARKIAWVLYAVIYLGLWATTTLEAYEGVYLWVALAALVYAFLFDTWVQQWLETQKLKKQYSRRTWSQIAEINEQIAKLHKQITEGHHPNVDEARRQIRELEIYKGKLIRDKI